MELLNGTQGQLSQWDTQFFLNRSGHPSVGTTVSSAELFLYKEQLHIELSSQAMAHPLVGTKFGLRTSPTRGTQTGQIQDFSIPLLKLPAMVLNVTAQELSLKDNEVPLIFFQECGLPRSVSASPKNMAHV